MLDVSNIFMGECKMYKLIALDMDGTLLNEKKQISERTKNAIKEARRRGVYVVLASGRPLEGILKSLDELKLVSDDDYVLSYNGCLVQKVKSRETISDLTLKGSDLEYLYNLSKDLSVNIHSFSKERGLMAPKHSKYTKVEADINNIDINIVSHDEIDHEEVIVKIMMIDEPEILDKAIKGLPKDVYEKYSVAKSTPYFLEFFNTGADKGQAIKKLAEHLGIDQKEIITMGDAMNDYQMIEYAGMGIAMGNADPRVKEIANHITETNDNDGVALAIEKFIFNM